MAVNFEADILLEHLEQFLGAMKSRWRRKNEFEESFEVFLYSEQPESDCQCLVTFGLSAHQLQLVGKCDCVFRMELAICASSLFDSKALGALLFAVGLDILEHHTTPGVHGVLGGCGSVLANGNPIFEHLYLASPGYFPHEFELCLDLSPPVAIIQLIPISSGERDLIENEGWEVFEDAIIEQGIDLLEFDGRREVCSVPR